MAINNPPIRLIVFAKAPIAGFAKTRLIPALGEQRAAQLAQRLFAHTLNNAVAAKFDCTELCVTPPPDDPIWRLLAIPPQVIFSDQGEGDLGERMARACGRSIIGDENSDERVLLIGTDCPSLTASILQAAAQSLIDYDAVIIPASDGGYTLLGIKRFHASLFKISKWSATSVYSETVDRIKKLQWTLKIFPEMHDIDEAEDLRHLPIEWPESTGG